MTEKSQKNINSMMLKRTPLFDDNVALGAKMVGFGGWEMPVSYSGIINEHLAVRSSAGLFDVGHMGIAEISGPGALSFIQNLATNDASKLEIFRAQYSILCNDRGGVVDDILVYRLPDKFILILNASNAEKDLAWLKSHATNNVKIEHRNDLAMLSLQGPKAELILSGVCDINLAPLKHNDCAQGKVFGKTCAISRTGYTGEDGFELILSSQDCRAVWEGLLEKGKAFGLLPCGLGARDSLRLEAALPLYGHEYTEGISPLEAGYGWAVKLEKSGFIGKDALSRQKAGGVKKKLVGLELQDRSIPRQGYTVFLDEAMNDNVGEVTSGTFSPFFKKPIGMAYLDSPSAILGSVVWVNIRDKACPGKIVGLPFYKRSPRR